MRLALALSALLLFSGAGNLHAAAAAGPTQRDWMVNLVDGLGWSFGLPDQPGDADYLKILDGVRTLRIEAEAYKQPTDLVAVKSFSTFGTFSGTGWVSGIATPTSAHLRFILPCSGNYRMTAALRLPGHRIELAGRIFTADGGQSFTTVDLGDIELAAGEHEAVLNIPPNGAIDYLELAAPPLQAVRPLGGWALDQPLTIDDLAVTTARVLLLEPQLPPADEANRIEAEAAIAANGVEVTDASHLGAPSGGRWIRAGAAAKTVTFAFEPPVPGVYALMLRGAASAPVTGNLNNRFDLTAAFPPFLQNLPIGTYYLDEGESRLELTLPPRSGIDVLLLERRRSDGADYRRLLGLPAGEEASPSPELIDQLLSLLAALGAPR